MASFSDIIKTLYGRLVLIMSEVRTKSQVSAKVDPIVKQQATEKLARMGIDTTTAINMFFRQIIAVDGLPFTPVVPKEEVSDEEFFSMISKAPKTRLEVVDGVLLVGGEPFSAEKHPEIHEWLVNE